MNQCDDTFTNNISWAMEMRLARGHVRMYLYMCISAGGERPDLMVADIGPTQLIFWG